MTYPFDPEFAAAIPTLPAIDLSALPAQHRRMAELGAAQIGECDTTGVTVHARSCPARMVLPMSGCASTSRARSPRCHQESSRPTAQAQAPHQDADTTSPTSPPLPTGLCSSRRRAKAACFD
ncbi:hypothetical protein [Amycolatopsis sp.]|uniref:hypothetical protein n=1 Tax=Amycolatopsis sp. TaxID=37632 RepID=UPI002601B7C2|nr:hypothetical protein [Amycolatopsis sp.]